MSRTNPVPKNLRFMLILLKGARILLNSLNFMRTVCVPGAYPTSLKGSEQTIKLR